MYLPLLLILMVSSDSRNACCFSCSDYSCSKIHTSSINSMRRTIAASGAFSEENPVGMRRCAYQILDRNRNFKAWRRLALLSDLADPNNDEGLFTRFHSILLLLIPYHNSKSLLDHPINPPSSRDCLCLSTFFVWLEQARFNQKKVLRMVIWSSDSRKRHLFFISLSYVVD